MAEAAGKTSSACIFCRIASGDARADIVHQDDAVVGFRDLNPQAPMHVLVIPRKHIPSLRDLSEEDDTLVGRLVRVCAKVAEAEGKAEAGFRVVANSGPSAGQSVDHLHLHVLAGRSLGWPPG